MQKQKLNEQFNHLYFEHRHNIIPIICLIFPSSPNSPLMNLSDFEGRNQRSEVKIFQKPHIYFNGKVTNCLI